MVVLRLGELPDAVHELERLAEAPELERALECAVDLAPPIRIGHDSSIYDRALTMAVSTKEASTRAPERAEKDRPSRELVIAVFFGPLARVLVQVLLPLRVAPPAVVLANVTAGLAAAVALGRGELVLAALLLQVKTLLDNADGLLARATGRVTRLGRYLDTEADLVVNVAIFAALGYATGQPWLAVVAFLGASALLSVGFNYAELHREAHGRGTMELARAGGAPERALEAVYRMLFAPQDRLVRRFSQRRLDGLLTSETDRARMHQAALAYHDRLTSAVLANTGLSTQLAALGVCLVAGAPAVYFWLVLVCVAGLPLLQLRRERLARRALGSGGAA
jgi:archaetidylinositol phosphate synthase